MRGEVHSRHALRCGLTSSGERGEASPGAPDGGGRAWRERGALETDDSLLPSVASMLKTGHIDPFSPLTPTYYPDERRGSRRISGGRGGGDALCSEACGDGGGSCRELVPTISSRVSIPVRAQSYTLLYSGTVEAVSML